MKTKCMKKLKYGKLQFWNKYMWIETNRTTQIKAYYKVSIVISTIHFFYTE